MNGLVKFGLPLRLSMNRQPTEAADPARSVWSVVSLLPLFWSNGKARASSAHSKRFAPRLPRRLAGGSWDELE
jgi:hypothetical protein